MFFFYYFNIIICCFFQLKCKEIEIPLLDKRIYFKDKKIPKTLNIALPDVNNIPLAILKNINYHKDKNPNWEVKIYDNHEQEKYILNNFPEYIKHFKSINEKFIAGRVDLFRYLLMYKEGGVYMDCKSFFNHKIDNFVENENFVCVLNSHMSTKDIEGFEMGEISQWVIMTIPKHPIIKKVIKNVIYNIENYDKLIHNGNELINKICAQDTWFEFKPKEKLPSSRLFLTTGPIVYTQTVEPFFKKYRIKLYLANMAIFRVSPYIGKDYRKIIYGKNKHYKENTEYERVVLTL